MIDDRRSRLARVRSASIAAAVATAFAVLVFTPTAAAVPTPTTSANPGITVDVIDDQMPAVPAATPTPTASTGSGGSNPANGSSGAGSSSGSSGGSTTGVVPASDESPEVPPGERKLFVVGGLTATGHPSANPIIGGTVSVELTVQNLTGETIDATADFRVEDVFGAELATISGVQIAGLAPDERRVVSVDLGEVRIAGLAHAFATVTPPETVGELELDPVERDAWAVLPSWYAVGVFGATAIGLGIWALLRFRSVGL